MNNLHREITVNLAKLMQNRHSLGERPYTLVIGSNLVFTQAHKKILADQLGGTSWIEVFRKLSADERYTILSSVFSTIGPHPCYKPLSLLIKQGYIKLILSTDLSVHLEISLQEAGVKNESLDVIVLSTEINDITNRLYQASPSVKLVKVHGDLKTRALITITPDEALRNNERFEDSIRLLLNQDIIVVGLDQDDYDIQRFISSRQGALWIVTDSALSNSNFVYSLANSRITSQIIELDPTTFFTILWSVLEPHKLIQNTIDSFPQLNEKKEHKINYRTPPELAGDNNKVSFEGAIINHVIVQQATNAEISISQNNNSEDTMSKKSVEHKSAWANGLFYLSVFITVITGLGILANSIPWYTLALILVAAVIFVPLIGALQLRQDKNLSEKGFLELVSMVIRQLPLIGRLYKKK